LLLDVDDSDQKLTYSPTNSWYSTGVSQEYQGTSHSTKQPNATVDVSFVGTLIAVYGTVSNFSGRARLTLDDEESYVFDPSGVSSEEFRQPIYSFGGLTSEEHRLTITTLDDASFTLDFLQITTNDTQGFGSNTPSQGSDHSVGSNFNSNADSSGAAPSQKAGLAPGAIAGIAIGAVILLVVFAVAGWIVLSKRFGRQLPARSLAEKGFEIVGKDGERKQSRPDDISRYKPRRAAPAAPISNTTQTTSTSRGAQSTAMFTSVFSLSPLSSSSDENDPPPWNPSTTAR